MLSIFLLSIFGYWNVDAQSKNRCYIQYTDIMGIINVEDCGALDSLTFRKIIENKLTSKQNEGFLLVNMDSINKDSSKWTSYIELGKKFNSLSISNLSELKSKVKLPEYFTPRNWVEFSRKIVKEDLNTGYPFSKIALKSMDDVSDSLIAIIDYNKGPFIKYGELEERNGIVVSEVFLQRLFNLQMGKPFNQRNVVSIEYVLSQLPYLESVYSPRVNFNGDKANIHLYLKKKRANSFDILLGFTKQVKESSSSFQLTGQANFDLLNSFKIGERIYFHYENLQAGSPRINFKLEFPFIKVIPVGLGIDFNLFKFNEQFINIQTEFKVQKILSKGEELSVIALNNYSYLLTIDSIFIKSNNRLPQSLDFKYLSYGLSYKKFNLDYLNSPTKGYSLELKASIGRKYFVRNPNILFYDKEERLNREYDSLNNINIQSNLQVMSSYYYSLSKRQVIKVGINASAIFSKAKILQNEVFRIGGINSLRGFNDNFFSSDGFVITTLEYRFLLDRNSYLSAFVDHSYMSLITQTENLPWKNYIGLGLGLKVQTQAGAFGLFFAVSRTDQISFDFADTKVHFGYIARF